MIKNNNSEDVLIGDKWITIADVVKIANNQGKVVLNNTPEFVKNIQSGADFLANLLQEEGVIYGVTTGYGDSCTRPVEKSLVEELPIHLSRFHGCGLGNYFSASQSRAIMAARLVSLARGKSGVRYKLLQQLELFLSQGISPLIPEEGSVGASGDLTPLSYVAAALMGERKVYFADKIRLAKDVLAELSIDPIKLAPKEGLALMNGTAVMTALACLAYSRAEYLCQLGARLTAMTSIALRGNPSHFHEKLFQVKPHDGQNLVAQWIREDLQSNETQRQLKRLQDRYSLRCAPHVIGALQDALPWVKHTIENELNSANDNPIILWEEEMVLHGGHFYGGHIAMVMDTLKTQVANQADLLDRQMAQLLDTKYNHGLPSNLSGASGKRASINHGLKALHIGASAWTAEALKNTMPASVFSRSTECHNQDKVSMGTIAARDCLRVLQLTEQVFAAHILATSQALHLRMIKGELSMERISSAVAGFLEDVLSKFPLVEEDRPLEDTLRLFVTKIQEKHWSLYDGRV